jgi:GMP synthase (glutamine-hydrolysing)|tara:strand:+ start:28 stop:552 length:525 start_codon:yes stop_codon:yes gene_type:complete
MILVVNVCKERLHYYEFVKPVVDILENEEVLVSHYEDLNTKDLERCDKVIICGTSLKDEEFVLDVEKFDWLKDFDKPVLGICAGFQILGMVFCGKVRKSLEVGFFREEFVEDFLGLSGEVEVYHLHNNYVDFPLEWRIYSGVEFAQAVKWNNFYGVLFHPEVRNKEMILRFAEL